MALVTVTESAPWGNAGMERFFPDTARDPLAALPAAHTVREVEA